VDALPRPALSLQNTTPTPSGAVSNASVCAGKPALLVGLHGWLLSARLWQPLQRELEPRWQLWCPDLPGFGIRPRPRGLHPCLASYGRWLADQVRAEAGDRPVVLLGHSLGGSVALHAAPLLGEQLRGMVLIAAGGGVYQPRPFARVRLGGALFLRWRPGWLAGLPGTEWIRSPLRAELRAARGLLACSTNRGAVQQLPRLTAALAVPSLWIAGSRDQVMEPRYVRHLAGYSPLHRLELVEGAGHLPMLQMPVQLAGLIEAWLGEELGLDRSPGASPRGVGESAAIGAAA
jgi:2-succinyl-6-hydroxy-2,4-cyclohexadiene-1-carboxylate synthase